jgi:hypothetical protein
LPRSRPIGEGVCTGALRGWERHTERLPSGYRLDTIDVAIWVLGRLDGTAASYFGVWSATREVVERAAGEDRRVVSKQRTTLFIRGMYAALIGTTLHMLDAGASALGEGQTRREAGTQSLSGLFREAAGLPKGDR